ncbi:MAG: hypothetical protein LBE35_10955 [Clostridiales bacterium]|jgi:hypothetical protein|nr:hypothetical protein [Clostridiales bacterium]
MRILRKISAALLLLLVLAACGGRGGPDITAEIWPDGTMLVNNNDKFVGITFPAGWNIADLRSDLEAIRAYKNGLSLVVYAPGIATDAAGNFIPPYEQLANEIAFLSDRGEGAVITFQEEFSGFVLIDSVLIAEITFADGAQAMAGIVCHNHVIGLTSVIHIYGEAEFNQEELFEIIKSHHIFAVLLAHNCYAGGAVLTHWLSQSTATNSR